MIADNLFIFVPSAYKSDFALPSLYVFYGVQEDSQTPPFSTAA
ncbi:MAG: hypothetical protein RLZZ207_775 [Bacteroidota bacterium]